MSLLPPAATPSTPTIGCDAGLAALNDPIFAEEPSTGSCAPIPVPLRSHPGPSVARLGRRGSDAIELSIELKLEGNGIRADLSRKDLVREVLLNA
jgi:hypothetical protein